MSKIIYNKIGKTYNNTRHADKRITDILIRLISYPAGSIVADIGAGTGNYSYELAKKNYSVIAVEPSETMINQGRSHENLKWIKASAENIPLESNSVDAVICTLAVHHFKSVESFISESKRILKSDGNLVIFTFDPNLLSDNDWLKYYFIDLHNNAMDSVLRQNVMVDLLESEFKNKSFITDFSLPSNLTDSFFRSAWKYPEKYLDSEFRNGISAFKLADEDIVNNALSKLQKDLQSGAWDKKYNYVRALEYFNADYYYISVGKLKT